MYSSRIVEQVIRKPKAMTGALRRTMIVFAVIFVALGIMISQARGNMNMYWREPGWKFT